MMETRRRRQGGCEPTGASVRLMLNAPAAPSRQRPKPEAGFAARRGEWRGAVRQAREVGVWERAKQCERVVRRQSRQADGKSLERRGVSKSQRFGVTAGMRGSEWHSEGETPVCCARCQPLGGKAEAVGRTVLSQAQASHARRLNGQRNGTYPRSRTVPLNPPVPSARHP